MKYKELSTPSLLVDRDIVLKNLEHMRDYITAQNVKLRPHTKTHKSPKIAKLQMEYGAYAVTVAKTSEAKVMIENGIPDVFIANEVVGDDKLQMISDLSKKATISFGADSIEHIKAAQQVFSAAGTVANIVIEIEVGDGRSGVVEESYFAELLSEIKASPNVYFKGIFSHDGHSYRAESVEHCLQISKDAQERTLHFAELAKAAGLPCDVVSYGSTPPILCGTTILDGITEIRPGTYVYNDVAQCGIIGTLDRAAVSVLTTVISRPTAERVITDVGAKGLTMQERADGICKTGGKGTVLEYPSIKVKAVYDEHAVIYDAKFRESVSIGEKLRIIPAHVCPVCNLYEVAYLISGDEVLEEISIAARGKLF